VWRCRGSGGVIHADRYNVRFGLVGRDSRQRRAVVDHAGRVLHRRLKESIWISLSDSPSVQSDPAIRFVAKTIGKILSFDLRNAGGLRIVRRENKHF
jgi:hypothetical protein